MSRIQLRFYAHLNDFIVPALRKREFSHVFDRNASVKDMIESFGVPHTEIELILVNGVSVDFNYNVQDGDYISVYPPFTNFDVSSLLRLRPSREGSPQFIADANLGRLARYLRLLGFDCLYRNDYDDATVAEIASQQHRMVLTRDRALLKRKIIEYGYFVRSVMPKLQTREVLDRFDLYAKMAPFTRCAHCNAKLAKIGKQKVEHRLKPLTKKYVDAFLICPKCGHLYWQGSHHSRAKKLLGVWRNRRT